jgi:GTP-binding protein Era
MTKPIQSGFAAIVGRPNVGKSTLLNAIIGEKIAIVSNKPQTTRRRITGILNRPGLQIAFTDTPGLHLPRTRLGEVMICAVNEAVGDVDVTILVVEPLGKITKADRDLLTRLGESQTPCILAVNKIDQFKAEDVARTIQVYAAAFPFAAVVPISALNKVQIDILVEETAVHMSEGPAFFPEEMTTDQPDKVILEEIVREKLLANLQQEIPHGTAVEVIKLDERSDGSCIDIFADITCERDTHKAIIIGKRGAMLKKIATEARQDMEVFYGTKVFLECFVKVRSGWRDNPSSLRNLGFTE